MLILKIKLYVCFQSALSLFWFHPHFRVLSRGFLNTTLFQSSNRYMVWLGCEVLISLPLSSRHSLFFFLSFRKFSFFQKSILPLDFDYLINPAASHEPKESWCNWEGKPHNCVGRSPQWIWSLVVPRALHLFTPLSEITKTSMLETFKRIVINGGPSYMTSPRRMKFFATFRRVWIFRNFLRVLKERFLF